MNDNGRKMKIAITGTLRIPRVEVAALINQTSNGSFVETVTFQTRYLVTATTDSNKAKKAARIGTSVIGEQELFQYISDGCFPNTALPPAPIHDGNNFPEIVWVEMCEPPETYLLEYRDAKGNWSIRTVRATGKGHTEGDSEIQWLGGYDGPTFKTWRRDRILSLELVG